MADQPNDAVDERQNTPRRGLEGKGYDAGTGYGGAGSDSLYSGESSYGGQSGAGGSTLGGAYRGEGYGRQGDDDQADGDHADDLEGGMRAGTGAGGEPSTAGLSTTADSTDDADDGVPRDPDSVDLEDMSGATRREPGR